MSDVEPFEWKDCPFCQVEGEDCLNCGGLGEVPVEP